MNGDVVDVGGDRNGVKYFLGDDLILLGNLTEDIFGAASGRLLWITTTFFVSF